MAVESPLLIIFEMIRFLIESSVNALRTILGLFLDLVGSLGFLSAIGGVGVLVLSVIIIAVVVFFLGKFVAKSWKGIAVLGLAGAAIIALMLLGLAMG